ncbi:MAG: Rieske 2Fe-2S domain-containing protein [Gammaproteobacteria bacterium]|nr:Rieske 2Fe-2S domain-containing protein [Gammaproteobacteria bacterium]
MQIEPVCRIDDIPQNSACGFEVNNKGIVNNIIIVNWHNKFYIYKNHCPHTGVGLEWIPNQFFNGDNTYLQCSTHGALFRPEDGFCVAGPCAGKSLEKLPMTIIKKGVYLK